MSIAFPDVSTPRKAFEVLLGTGEVVWLLLDPTAPGVEMPEGAGEGTTLILNYGLNLPIPIPDLVVDDEGIRATLSFGRTPYATFVPWSAVHDVRLVRQNHVVAAVFPRDVQPQVNPAPTGRPKLGLVP